MRPAIAGLFLVEAASTGQMRVMVLVEVVGTVYGCQGGHSSRQLCVKWFRFAGTWILLKHGYRRPVECIRTVGAWNLLKYRYRGDL